MESFRASLGYLTATGYVESALIPLFPSVLIAVVWFFHRKPLFLDKSVSQRISEAAAQQWETGMDWLGLTLGTGSCPLPGFLVSGESLQM